MRLLASIGHRITARLAVCLVAALCLAFAQTTLAETAVASGSTQAPAAMPCHMDMTPGGEMPATSPAGDKGGCPMMSGATCIALSATVIEDDRDITVAEHHVTYLWPADAAPLVRAPTPPDRPPKTL